MEAGHWVVRLKQQAYQQHEGISSPQEKICAFLIKLSEVAYIMKKSGPSTEP